MEPTDITVQILQDIRNGIQQTNERLSQTNERMDERFELLGRRLTESELRTATALTEVASTLGGIKRLLAERLDLSERVESCEKEIIRIKGHVGLTGQ